MNLNTANLMVGKAASTAPARPHLNSIHVTGRHTEATNDHILARVSLPTQYDPGDVPVTCPTAKAEELTPFVCWILIVMYLRCI